MQFPLENTSAMANMRTSYPPRQTLSPGTAQALLTALRESQLSYRQAASRIGISSGYLHGLTHGTRCPSREVAVGLIDALVIPEPAAADLLAEAAEGRGKDRQENATSVVPGRLGALRS